MIYLKKIIAFDNENFTDLIQELDPYYRDLGRKIVKILQKAPLYCFGLIDFPIELSAEEFIYLSNFIKEVTLRLQSSKQVVEPVEENRPLKRSGLFIDLLQWLPEEDREQGQKIIYKLIDLKMSGKANVTIPVVVPQDRFKEFNVFMKKAIQTIWSIEDLGAENKTDSWN